MLMLLDIKIFLKSYNNQCGTNKARPMKQNRKSRNRFIYTYNLCMMKLELQIGEKGII